MVVGIHCSVLVATDGLQYQFYLTTLGSMGSELLWLRLLKGEDERW